MMYGHGIMSGMGAMTWGMSFIWLLVVVVLVLGAAALTKYLFSSRHPR